MTVPSALRPLLLLLALLAGPAVAEEEAAAPATPWQVEVALEGDVGLNGCVVGDLDPRHDGAEIAAVAQDGGVHVVRRGDDGVWVAERVADLGGEMIQCAIGDAHPGRPGLELVAVGMVQGREGPGPGAAHVVWQEGDGWRAEPLFEDEALIHGACVAELDRAQEGPEILLVGFSDRATLVRREGEGWSARTVAELGAAGKCAVPWRDGAAIGLRDGRLVHLRETADGHALEVIDEAPAGQSRLAAAGDWLLAARDDGVLAHIGPGGREEIHREPRKLRGAVLADLDASPDGLEAATCGYTGRLTLLRPHPGPGGWEVVPIHREDAPLHHLAAGVLPGMGSAPVLVAAGHGGRLLVAHRRP